MIFFLPPDGCEGPTSGEIVLLVICGIIALPALLCLLDVFF